jgi:nucleoid-associated protein Lsr2
VAQRNVTTYIDDLTGKELADGTGETVTFSLDGVLYELDVNSRGAQKLRSALAPYVKAGRRIAAGKSKRPARRSKVASDPAAVRAWASSNGIPVSNRGRVPAAVIAQFEAAGN